MSTSTALTDRVAAQLRAEMARRRLVSADLARALSCHPSSAARRMSGEVSLSIDEVETIAGWLGVTPSTLLDSERAA